MTQVAATVPIQGLGRELVQNLFVALRSAQLYDARNDTLRAAAERFARTLEELHLVDRCARLEVGGDLILVNDVRIRSELRSYSVHANLLRFFREMGIGGFEWDGAPDVGEAARFVSVVGRMELEDESDDPVFRLRQRLVDEGLGGMRVLEPREEETEALLDDPDKRRRAERTYRHTVAVTRQLMESLRAGQTLRLTRMRRAVQSIVDQVFDDESLLVGLTNLRDYDEPTFTHSVNVCIFAVSLGQRIGLSRLELYELGMAGLLHDLGKVDVPRDVLLKSEPLSEEEWEAMQRHPAFGAWRIMAGRQRGRVPAREMLAAFEHHLNVDLSGYPAIRYPRKLSLYSRIVAICDSFDAGTTPRVYKTDPITPAEMLQALDRWKGVRYDPILIKAFVSLLGIYPPGCVLLLDTQEIAVVMAADPDPRSINRPRVKLVVDSDGLHVDGLIVSLAERARSGDFARTVIKVLEPERYGIDSARYFLAG
ncbi:MAG TPA: HD domain-containing phosphohydrolase [Gemmatimonadota bacterium]|nr:HD domain-containing phosphohydrolase [Gemmatimonadota bacterium]